MADGTNTPVHVKLRPDESASFNTGGAGESTLVVHHDSFEVTNGDGDVIGTIRAAQALFVPRFWF